MAGGQSDPTFKLPAAGVDSPPKMCDLSLWETGGGRCRVRLAGAISTMDITALLVHGNIYCHFMVCPLRIVILSIMLITE